MIKRAVVTAGILLAVLQPASRATLQAQGVGEGLKVHGHWTIEIHDANGALVSHHEFENALVTTTSSLMLTPGSKLLALLATGEYYADWRVYLDAATPEDVDLNGEFHTTGASPNGVFPMSIEILHPDTTGNALLLEGQGTAKRAGTIETVATVLGLNNWGHKLNVLIPATTFFGPFTFAHVMDDHGNNIAVPVLEGQVISVKVLISFS